MAIEVLWQLLKYTVYKIYRLTWTVIYNPRQLNFYNLTVNFMYICMSLASPLLNAMLQLLDVT